MVHLILRRLVLAVPILIIVSVLTFILAGLVPGDAARAILGTEASEDAVAALRDQMGLDQPLVVRYWDWLTGVFHGDFGVSTFSGEPVTKLLNAGAPITLTLIAGAVIATVVLGIPLGTIAATHPRSVFSRIVNGLAIVSFSIPSFWFGFLLILVFAVGLKMFPVSGWVSPSDSATQWLASIALPITALAVNGIGAIARQTRDQMIDVLGRPFIAAMRARGLSERSIVYKHALRSALAVVVTQISLFVVNLILGTTLIEAVFAVRGLGSIAVEATSLHDLALLQGVAIYLTLFVVIAFTIAEVITAWLNPKLRKG